MELEKPKEKQNKEGISYIVSREAVDSSARLQFAFFSARSWEGEDSDDVEKEISRQASKAQSVKEGIVRIDNISGLPDELLVRILSLVPTFTACTYGFYQQESAIT
ncbi:hypothetical protein F2Q69_00008755 [Brassica cretica]|uniref:F-box domain-containing protein n=1 Tax=Brassica cretica TaxID=69181 RepID=A0A8S9NNI0_BRACR|nr:hypothetical protein F2Q69_00008755 [Brassica cretica]